MVIQSSDVALGSKRQYQSQSTSSMSYSSWGNYSKATLPTAKEGDYTTGSFSTRISGASYEYSQSSMMYTASGLFKEDSTSDAKKLSHTGDSEENGVVTTSRKKTVDYVMQQRLQSSVSQAYRSLKDIFEELLAQHQKKFRDLFQIFSAQTGNQNYDLSALQPTQEWGATYSEEEYYQEWENTQFQSTGQVVTADGRSVNFDVGLYMSRSFMEYSGTTMNMGSPLTDPLVINLSGQGTELTNQQFLFDIDCDGELDNISILKESSGYLALDKNDDGKINDGSELFGTQSGDGFSDLTVYDMDGNGWIDENDPIFDKLRIWTKSPSGEDQLIGLGVAGVGAIFLGKADTQFNLNNSANDTLGVVRKTGVFLHEDGRAGTVQQVDLAKRQSA